MLGETISHYKIVEKLGEGGMGVVYKAEDIKLRRTVALKFLSPNALGTTEEKARFIHEAQAAAALNHPNICTIYEVDESEGRSYIAMEYIEGPSLKDNIASGPLKMEEAQRIAMQVAEGLNEAHQRQIVHRDIKPANIMITASGRVKIMDFGMAKSPELAKLTREGTTLGTASYMSPEQGHGEPVDSRSDIWSLGVILHEMVTGKLPFKGDYEQAVLYSILHEDPKPMTAFRTGVPLELERIAHKAMKKNQDERYQHADELLADLRTLSAQTGAPVQSGRSEKKRFTKGGLGLVLSAIIVIIAAFILFRSYLSPEKRPMIESIAVLPLDNLSGDPEQEYFADGMTEALIADLAKIGTFKVISRTSVMRYKNSQKSLPEIGRELDVDVILEGSVMQVGGRVRITAQLIEAVTDRHLWAENYERDMRDILALQSDVARAIAREINIKLAPLGIGGSSGELRVDPLAYEAYLKGRYHWNKTRASDSGKSIAYFEETSRIDPEYAQCFAALAEAFLVICVCGYLPAREAYQKINAYAQRAITIDIESAAAYSALAAASFKLGNDWEVAEEYFIKAISLNPNYATAHQWYADFLTSSGRHDEALEQILVALKLDPLSLIFHQTLGFIYYYARRYDEAIEQCRKTIELDKNYLAPQENQKGFYMPIMRWYSNTNR